MNNIIYAGKDEKRAAELEESGKLWQLIRCTARGEIKTAHHTETYGRSDVLVIPPLTKYERSACNSAETYIFMEATALPFRHPACVAEERGGGLAHAFSQAEYYFSEGGERGAPILKALGDLIVSYIVAQTERPAYSPVVESVRADIAANLDKPAYALDAFMRTLPLNYDYVRKLFKSEVGVTPHEYLISARMQLAARLILSGMTNQYGKCTISQIAEMCGYSEPLYFSRVFKKYHGMAPSDYAGKSSDNG